MFVIPALGLLVGPAIAIILYADISKKEKMNEEAKRKVIKTYFREVYIKDKELENEQFTLSWEKENGTYAVQLHYLNELILSWTFNMYKNGSIQLNNSVSNGFENNFSVLTDLYIERTTKGYIRGKIEELNIQKEKLKQEIPELYNLKCEIDALSEKILSSEENLSVEDNHQIVCHFTSGVEEVLRMYIGIPNHLKNEVKEEMLELFEEVKTNLLHKKMQMDEKQLMEIKKQMTLLKKRV